MLRVGGKDVFVDGGHDGGKEESTKRVDTEDLGDNRNYRAYSSPEPKTILEEVPKYWRFKYFLTKWNVFKESLNIIGSYDRTILAIKHGNNLLIPAGVLMRIRISINLVIFKFKVLKKGFLYSGAS